MRSIYCISVLIVFFVIVMPVNLIADVNPAADVIARVTGDKTASNFRFEIDKSKQKSYSINVKNNKVYIVASDQATLCRATYDYLSNACNSIVSWSGNRINIPEVLPEYTRTVQSPFTYHYYLNVVIHGYTMPYWDWVHWEKEID
ncbi:MAG: hypothetical protein GZ091_00510 [Paludibacter sp.]|nr:hypothetical protein [Paludibacter sp.]